ncbi:MAG: DUF2029 domain-containing protein [Planctomycetia bacterium]|nr:DUF2029 domain-containing protein [Planctomycetia bacterium]
MTEAPAPTLFRRLLVGAAAVVALLLLLWQLPRLADPRLFPVDDFVEYWSAGRLNLTGGDPYSAQQLFPLQQEVGCTLDYAIMMWNPPWTLTLVMPFGMLSYPAGRFAWLLLHALLAVGCADAVWRFYGGRDEQRWLAWLLALSFTPTLVVLRMGQIAPFMLLGLTGFLLLQASRRDVAAGAFLVLSSIKPHLVYLVWAAWLCWIVQERRWRMLLSAAACGLVLLGVAAAVNPNVIAQYRQATAERPPVDWITTTFGTLLRVLFAPEQRWLHFLPPALGLLWFAPYWWNHRRRWDWQEQLPFLLLVSYVTAAFGWLGDQVVLILPLVALAAWTSQRADRRLWLIAGVSYAVLNLADLTLNAVFPAEQLVHLWTAPALLIGYLLLRPTDGSSLEIPPSGGERFAA